MLHCLVFTGASACCCRSAQVHETLPRRRPFPGPWNEIHSAHKTEICSSWRAKQIVIFSALNRPNLWVPDLFPFFPATNHFPRMIQWEANVGNLACLHHPDHPHHPHHPRLIPQCWFPFQRWGRGFLANIRPIKDISCCGTCSVSSLPTFAVLGPWNISKQNIPWAIQSSNL